MELKNDITDELRGLSPLLASLPRRHPFIVPDHYFEEAEEEILDAVSGANLKLMMGDALSEQAHPFEVPDGYFSGLPDKILSRIKQGQSDEDPPKVVPLRRYLSPARVWLAAASFALLFATSYFLWFQQPSSRQVANQEMEAADDNTTTGENDLLVNVVDIDEGMVVELLVQDELARSNAANDRGEYNPSLIDVTDIDDAMLEEI